MVLSRFATTLCRPPCRRASALSDILGWTHSSGGRRDKITTPRRVAAIRPHVLGKASPFGRYGNRLPHWRIKSTRSHRHNSEFYIAFAVLGAAPNPSLHGHTNMSVVTRNTLR